MIYRLTEAVNNVRQNGVSHRLEARLLSMTCYTGSGKGYIYVLKTLP
jgi:hypothetical protein